MNEKDFDYNEFVEFMNSLSGFSEAVNLERKARNFDVIETLDVIDESVTQSNDLTLAKHMLSCIGVVT